MGATPLLSTTDGAKLVLWRGWKQDKNQINLPVLWRTAFQAEASWCVI